MTLDDDEIERLVQQAKSGDAWAFGQVFDHYHRPVYRYIASRVHRPADVEMCVGQHLRRRVGVVAGVGEFGDAFIGAVADDEGEALRRLGRAGEDGPCGSGQKGTEGEAAPAGAEHGADREGGGGHGSTS